MGIATLPYASWREKQEPEVVMDTHERSYAQRITLQRAAVDTGLSVSTLRRAIRDPADPLPVLRVGNGDPAHARILVKRTDLEAWMQRRNAELTTPARSVVDEIVAKIAEDAA